MTEISAHTCKLDDALVEEAKAIKVLSAIEWPAEIRRDFLAAWRKGNPTLPKITYPVNSMETKIAALDSVMGQCDRGNPIENFIFRSARSYRSAARLIECAGTKEFTEISIQLYGKPSDSVNFSNDTIRAAADHMMNITSGYVESCAPKDSDYCLMPEAVAQAVSQAAEILDQHEVSVVIDESLSAKAAAGATRIRIRGGTCFSKEDVDQLVNHELFVHSLTALNGRMQANLKTLGLGAPRTTKTQEGLALFSELITNSMDVNRLRRIAARNVAIDMALQGADFLEVFRYFLNIGSTENESYASAQRVFRGGDTKGGIAFTKDSVYLSGFVHVHDFLRDAIKEGDFRALDILISGRMATADVSRLAPYFDTPILSAPTYFPPWLRSRATLVAFLLHSSFTSQLHLNDLSRASSEEIENEG